MRQTQTQTQESDGEQSEATSRVSATHIHTLIGLGIIEVVETYETEEVNNYLKQGWWLLASTGSAVDINPRILYSLGKPQDHKKWCFK